jgi:hypothetical protein
MIVIKEGMKRSFSFQYELIHPRCLYQKGRCGKHSLSGLFNFVGMGTSLLGKILLGLFK